MDGGPRGSAAADLVSDLRALPIESDTANEAVAIHVLEHFYEWEAVDVLKEWRRILKPGGRLIVELPCLDKVLRYLAEAFTNRYPIRAHMTWWALYGDPRHKDPYMCHKWGYTERMLKDVLQEAGFTTINFEPPRYHVLQRDMRAVAIK